MVDVAAVVLWAVVELFDAAVRVRLDTFLGVIDEQCASAGFNLECRGHREEHAGCK